MGRVLSRIAVVTLFASGVPTLAQAQRPPPIVADFDGESTTDEPAAQQIADERAQLLMPRPLPPIVTDFDGPMDEDEPADPLMPTEEGDDEGPVVGEDGIAPEEAEDPAAARRLLQHSLLVERRRDMAARAFYSPSARLLASPFRDRASPPATGGTDAGRARLPRAIDRLELGVASASAPVTSLGVHDDGLRVRVGAGLDAFREPVGVRVRFEPAVLVMGDSTFALPRDSVRVGFALSGTYRTPLPDAPVAVFLGGGFEHASDIATAGPSELVMTNALFARGGAVLDAGPLHGLVRGTLALHVASDTVPEDENGAERSVELGIDLVVRSGAPESAEGNIQLCGALHASYLAPSGAAILEEARFGAMLGACARDATLGEISLMLEVNVGNEPRWDRTLAREHVGAVVRWSL